MLSNIVQGYYSRINYVIVSSFFQNLGKRLKYKRTEISKVKTAIVKE